MSGRLSRFEAGGQTSIGELFDIQFSAFEVGDKDECSASVMRFPHARHRFRFAESSEFANYSYDEEEREIGGAVKNHFDARRHQRPKRR